MSLRNLVLAALLVAAPAFAETNSCPQSSYLGWGQGTYLPPGGGQGSWTNLSVTFPSSAGIATLNGPFEYDADYQGPPTTDPDSWNLPWTTLIGDVTYDDGEVSYTGKARFWLHIVQAAVPYCKTDQIDRKWMVSRLRIRSCTTTGTLTNNFFASSTSGTYCGQVTNAPCDQHYAQENWLNLIISGPP